MDLMKMDVLRCDGRTAESVRRLGDVIGHVVPGVALAGWGLHLFIGACWRHALAERDPSAPRFFSRNWEPLLPFLEGRWPMWRRFNQLVPVDSLYKALFGSFLIVFIFPFQQIVCPDGVRPGRIVGQHIVRWAHTTLITCYAMVGFFELISFRLRVPAGAPTAAMVIAHTTCAVLFVYHQKHEILDQMSHGLLGYCFMAAAACGIMELAAPNSFMATAGKAYSHILGGLWLAIVGHIVFGDHTFWAPEWNGQVDVGPAMFVPVVFGQVMLATCFALLLVYLAVDALAAWRLRCGDTGLSFIPLGTGRGGAEEAQGLLGRREEPAADAAATLGDIQLGGVCSGSDADGFRPAHRKGGALPMY